MEQEEQFFACPYCFENISMVLDKTIDDEQSYVEDCEVCCKPIQLVYSCQDGEVLEFSAATLDE